MTKEKTNTLADDIKSLAAAAQLKNLGVLVIGARQNAFGRVQSVSDDALVLKDACLAYETGSIDSDKIESFERPPLGIIVCPMERIDFVFPKPLPKNWDNT